MGHNPPPPYRPSLAERIRLLELWHDTYDANAHLPDVAQALADLAVMHARQPKPPPKPRDPSNRSTR